MNMLGIENVNLKQTINIIQKFMEEDQAQIFKATPSYLEIVKNCAIHGSKNFKVFTTIEQVFYQYLVEMHVSDQLIISQVEKIGFDRFLHLVNEINMKDNNKFTLIWDSQKYEIILRTNISKFQKDTQVIKQNLHHSWHQLTQFIQSLFPVQSAGKQGPGVKSPSKQDKLLQKSVVKGMKKWKKLITARKKVQRDRKMNKNFCITEWLYYIKEYRLLWEEIEKSDKDRPALVQSLIIYNQRYLEGNYIPGKFSQVLPVQLEYTVMKSNISISGALQNIINAQTNPDQCQAVKTSKCVFIEKRPVWWNSDPFNNQVFLIKYLRNQKCNYISSYFFRQISKDEANETDFSKFYMPKYHKFTTELRTNQKFRIARDLAKGIQFLSSFFVVHRDLKPDNIVIDSSLSPKIIDFGSSALNHSQSSKTTDQKSLITTRTYNLQWEQLPTPIKSLIDRKYFNRHPLFDIYALGKIMDRTLRTQRTREKLGEVVMEFIDILVDQCTSKHPDDRLYPIEIIFFLSCFCEIKVPSPDIQTVL